MGQQVPGFIFKNQGRRYRLRDVHSEVVHCVLACWLVADNDKK